MSSVTVRISKLTRKILHDLAEQEGKSMQAVLEIAIEEYRRTRFLEDINQAYATARKTPEWSDVEKVKQYYQAWDEDRLVLDMANPIDENLSRVKSYCE